MTLTISLKPSVATTGTLNSVTVLRVYQRLYAMLGSQRWWPAKTRVEIVIGATLTQHATWRGVEQALGRLRQERAVTISGFQTLTRRRLARALRPSGCFRQKARRLRGMLTRLATLYGQDLRGMRWAHPASLYQELLRTPGIGPETADCILLYAAGRPRVVVDAYTCRIAHRLGWIPSATASAALRARLTMAVPDDPVLLNELHALFVALGKQVCRARPRCHICPLAEECPTAHAARLLLSSTRWNY